MVARFSVLLLCLLALSSDARTLRATVADGSPTAEDSMVASPERSLQIEAPRRNPGQTSHQMNGGECIGCGVPAMVFVAPTLLVLTVGCGMLGMLYALTLINIVDDVIIDDAVICDIICEACGCTTDRCCCKVQIEVIICEVCGCATDRCRCNGSRMM